MQRQPQTLCCVPRILVSLPNVCFQGFPSTVEAPKTRILVTIAPELLSGAARQTKPKKGPKRKVHEFRPFLWILVFFLGKTSMPLRKVHELAFLWFGLPGWLLILKFARVWGLTVPGLLCFPGISNPHGAQTTVFCKDVVIIEPKLLYSPRFLVHRSTDWGNLAWATGLEAQLQDQCAHACVIF